MLEESVEVYVERAGSGPPIVFSHGFGGSARNFRKQSRSLEQSHTVVSYDTRGHARSPAPEEPAAYEPRCLISDFARVMHSTGAPAVAAGLSLGAYTALAYALDAPEAPRGLILASYPTPRTDFERVSWAEGFAEAIEARGLDSAGAEFVWGPDSRFDANSAALIRQGFLEHAPHALAAMLRRVIAKIPEPEELVARLARLDVPTLIILGSEDAGAKAPSESLARHLANAELVTLAGAGHLVNLQATRMFNDAVRSFLDNLGQ